MFQLCFFQRHLQLLDLALLPRRSTLQVLDELILIIHAGTRNGAIQNHVHVPTWRRHQSNNTVERLGLIRRVIRIQRIWGQCVGGLCREQLARYRNLITSLGGAQEQFRCHIILAEHLTTRDRTGKTLAMNLD